MSDRIHQWRARGRSDLPIDVRPGRPIEEEHANEIHPGRPIGEDHAINRENAIDEDDATEQEQQHPSIDPGRPDRAQHLAQTVSTETGAM